MGWFTRGCLICGRVRRNTKKKYGRKVKTQRPIFFRHTIIRNDELFQVTKRFERVGVIRLVMDFRYNLEVGQIVFGIDN